MKDEVAIDANATTKTEITTSDAEASIKDESSSVKSEFSDEMILKEEPEVDVSLEPPAVATPVETAIAGVTPLVPVPQPTMPQLE